MYLIVNSFILIIRIFTPHSDTACMLSHTKTLVAFMAGYLCPKLHALDNLGLPDPHLHKAWLAPVTTSHCAQPAARCEPQSRRPGGAIRGAQHLLGEHAQGSLEALVALQRVGAAHGVHGVHPRRALHLLLWVVLCPEWATKHVTLVLTFSVAQRPPLQHSSHA